MSRSKLELAMLVLGVLIIPGTTVGGVATLIHGVNDAEVLVSILVYGGMAGASLIATTAIVAGGRWVVWHLRREGKCEDEAAKPATRRTAT